MRHTHTIYLCRSTFRLIDEARGEHSRSSFVAALVLSMAANSDRSLPGAVVGDARVTLSVSFDERIPPLIRLILHHHKLLHPWQLFVRAVSDPRNIADTHEILGALPVQRERLLLDVMKRLPDPTPGPHPSEGTGDPVFPSPLSRKGRPPRRRELLDGGWIGTEDIKRRRYIHGDQVTIEPPHGYYCRRHDEFVSPAHFFACSPLQESIRRYKYERRDLIEAGRAGHRPAEADVSNLFARG